MKAISKFVAALLLLALMLSVMPAAAAQPAQAASCYWAQFVADVSVPDGTSFAPGTLFRKTWRIKNSGTCAWNTPDVSLVFESGERMNAPASVALPTVVYPGQTVDISVDMTAPSAAGHYFGYYKFNSASGGAFGIGSTANKSFWVEIYVSGTLGTGYDFTANAGSAAWSSSAGALTFPGTDGNPAGFGLRVERPKLESGVEVAQPGLLFAPHNVTNGYVQATYPAFRVQSGDRFQATLGCEYGATNCYVSYSLNYQIGSGAVVTYWTFRERYEGLNYNVNLDLSPLAGQDVRFTLIVNAYGSPAGDRALWGNPVIARAGGAVITPVPVTPVTPLPITPVPSSCDRAQFIADVTVPDGTYFQPNTAFTKTWRLKNVGSCTWTNYSLIFDSGEKMSGPDSALIPASIAPGQTVDITVNLQAPVNAGTYRGYWKLKNSTGVPFGIGGYAAKSFWVEIRVAGTPVTPVTPVPVTPSTPVTPVTPATPISGTSYDFVSNVCAAKWYSGSGELPCPGTDGDARGFVLITAPSRLENGTNDTRPGLLTFPQNVSNGYIQGIYPAYKVKSGDKFRTMVNCEYGASNCYVVFRLDYSIAGSSSINTFWAFVERYEGQTYTADIDLSSLVGQDVKFILTVLSTGSAIGDRALWVAPIIYNASSSSAQPAPPATVTPSFTPTPTMITPVVTTPAATTPAPTTAVPPTATAVPTTAVPSAAPTTPVPTTPAPSATPVTPTVAP